MNDKRRRSTLISSVSSLGLCSVGGYRIFTNNIDDMSIQVAYIFFITGLICFVASVVELYRNPRT
ncbi:hypothetical protein FOH38_23520 [Lysinibacillus fusiformis]|nr:hypothetical protein FOH38_23520 [Lysinibacillus fusiformis]